MSARIERLAKGFAELGRILFLSHPNELTENILIPLRGMAPSPPGHRHTPPQPSPPPHPHGGEHGYDH